jgi:hypothetical protein
VKSSLVALLVGFAFLGCASTGGVASHAGVPKAIGLEFRGRAGETTETRYFSNERIQTYEDNQLLRDRYEGVDFTVASHVREILPKQNLIKFDVKTVNKDGTVELHDLAFPELNEEINYVIRNTGEVLEAGRYSPQSLFYVPAMPIPKGNVEVGDTWTMEHTWLSNKDGIPLTLQVVAILKDIVKCEGQNVCADIEISGHVDIAAKPVSPDVRFVSRLWGRLLFSLTRGDVIWSDMRSNEEMGMKGNRMVVHSCMVSEMKLNGDPKIKFNCTPDEETVTKTPVY